MDTKAPPECSGRTTKGLEEHRAQLRVINPNSDTRVFGHFCRSYLTKKYGLLFAPKNIKEIWMLTFFENKHRHVF